jgi:hypothetical protein
MSPFKNGQSQAQKNAYFDQCMAAKSEEKPKAER